MKAMYMVLGVLLIVVVALAVYLSIDKENFQSLDNNTTLDNAAINQADQTNVNTSQENNASIDKNDSLDDLIISEDSDFDDLGSVLG